MELDRIQSGQRPPVLKVAHSPQRHDKEQCRRSRRRVPRGPRWRPPISWPTSPNSHGSTRAATSTTSISGSMMNTMSQAYHCREKG